MNAVFEFQQLCQIMCWNQKFNAVLDFNYIINCRC